MGRPRVRARLHVPARRDPRPPRLRDRRSRPHLHRARPAHHRGRDPDRHRPARRARGRPPGRGVLDEPRVLPRARRAQLSARRLVGPRERRARARGRGQGAVDPARDPGADDRAPCGLPTGDALQGAGDPRDVGRRRRRRSRPRPGAQRRGRLGAGRAAARLRRDAARPPLGARLLAPGLQLLARARAGARRLLERRLPRQPRRLPQPAGRRPSDGPLLRSHRRRALPARGPLHRTTSSR